MCEDRSGVELERALVLVVDRHPRHVGGQQVRRELDPGVAALDGVGQRPGEHRLARAREVLQQDVALRQQAGQRQAHHMALAKDGLLHVVGELVEGGLEPLGLFRADRHAVFLSRREGRGRWSGVKVAGPCSGEGQSNDSSAPSVVPELAVAGDHRSRSRSTGFVLLADRSAIQRSWSRQDRTCRSSQRRVVRAALERRSVLRQERVRRSRTGLVARGHRGIPRQPSGSPGRCRRPWHEAPRNPDRRRWWTGRRSRPYGAGIRSTAARRHRRASVTVRWSRPACSPGS